MIYFTGGIVPTVRRQTTQSSGLGAVERNRTQVRQRSKSSTQTELFRDLQSGQQIAESIERTGWCCIENAVTDDWIAEALSEAQGHLSSAAYEVILEDLEMSPSSTGYDLANNARMLEMLHAVTEVVAPALDTTNHSPRTSIRIIVGEDPLGRPPHFHYDRSVVTMVIPVCMPVGTPGKSGELILVPNRRPFRRWVATNIIEKSFVQTGFFRRFFVRKLPAETTIVPLSVGNAYLFSGYRSYHTTLPCPQDGIRITIVIHFGEVHDGSRLLEVTKSTGRSRRLSRDSTVDVRRV